MRTVRAAVARLGERDRELIALRYGADLKVPGCFPTGNAIPRKR